MEEEVLLPKKKNKQTLPNTAEGEAVPVPQLCVPCLSGPKPLLVSAGEDCSGRSIYRSKFWYVLTSFAVVMSLSIYIYISFNIENTFGGGNLLIL